MLFSRRKRFNLICKISKWFHFQRPQGSCVWWDTHPYANKQSQTKTHYPRLPRPTPQTFYIFNKQCPSKQLGVTSFPVKVKWWYPFSLSILTLSLSHSLSLWSLVSKQAVTITLYLLLINIKPIEKIYIAIKVFPLEIIMKKNVFWVYSGSLSLILHFV